MKEIVLTIFAPDPENFLIKGLNFTVNVKLDENGSKM